VAGSDHPPASVLAGALDVDAASEGFGFEPGGGFDAAGGVFGFDAAVGGFGVACGGLGAATRSSPAGGAASGNVACAETIVGDSESATVPVAIERANHIFTGGSRPSSAYWAAGYGGMVFLSL
jgi:hypothetical protein